jgi:hypothetical protein
MPPCRRLLQTSVDEAFDVIVNNFALSIHLQKANNSFGFPAFYSLRISCR